MHTCSQGLFILVFFALGSIQARNKRGIDLIAAHGLISETRLPRDITPIGYKLELQPFIDNGTFKGRVSINLTWQEPTNEINIHAHPDMEIPEAEVKVTRLTEDGPAQLPVGAPKVPVKVEKLIRTPKTPIMGVRLDRQLQRGTVCQLDITFSGKMYNDTSEGLFRSSYKDPQSGETKWYAAAHMRPNLARTVFPCFDEPAYKVSFLYKIARKKNMVTLTNMPVERTEPMANNSEWVWDHFELSPPMSTFTVGMVISEFTSITLNKTYDDDDPDQDPDDRVKISVWSRPDFINALTNVTEKIERSLNIIRSFLGVRFTLPKLDCVALPNYQATRPADAWGLILFKESELSAKGSWHITQEIAYEWLGSLATPFWWTDSHVNNALVRYVTAYTTLKMYDGKETFNNWPMTTLYSIYYEFSKRYPHGKSTAIKQDSISAKTELVFRMLNFTLGEETFNLGIKKFMYDRQYKTFFADDIWTSLTKEARFHNKLPPEMSVNDIAGSWISKDRLPVVNVTRNYDDKTAVITQRVYLRERPHDVPDQEKFLWYIPIVLVRQDKMNFSNTRPVVWMKKEKTVKIQNMPKPDKFIIVNPEEIGPFPVNYDMRNWNMLAKFLNSGERTKIPVQTRAKLLHDAWNLAYAGDLSFATALNMTLFLRREREYLAWDPVFTMIDHIGRHIDSSSVHKKFQTYVRLLLTPLYEELGDEPQEDESEGRAHLRSSSKVFLCQAGYKPCIEEAQKAFKKWMESENPDEGNPVANQFICPVFKWGTKEEWEFGLQRVIKFPQSRKQNERTYLLKTLAGCPIDSWKIERLLNITVLEENGNFTDNDVYLIFSMLTGGANGYTTLFNFLKKNWDVIKVKFETKPHLWNSLVTSATSVFKTQEGLDMVSELYVQKQGEFGTADFVIERALKNIKEETKWSDNNLPVIEKWLDDYLKVYNDDVKKTN